jgi:amidase
MHTLEDIINCTKSDPREMYPARDIRAWEGCLKPGIPTPDSAEVFKAHQYVRHSTGRDGIFAAMDAQNLDALIMPTHNAFVFPAGAGSPVLSVPMGVLDSKRAETVMQHGDEEDVRTVVGPGMPFGLAFVGREWSEERLIGLGYGYEQLETTQRKRKEGGWGRPIIVPKKELWDFGRGNEKV